MSYPKSLAERLEWMAKNLPGFRDDLEAVDDVERIALARNLDPSRNTDRKNQAVERVLNWSADPDASRITWWLHSDRAEMRADPNWAVVFEAIRSASVEDSR